MSAPSTSPPELVPVERFPKTVAWGQVGFIALIVAAALVPLLLALALAA
jgi:hypothetical protein